MKKQEYIDMGIQAGLDLSHIEKILSRVMGISSSEFFMLDEFPSTYIYEIQKIFYQIQSGVPEAYTLQSAHFYGRDFFVDARVLIPRNDTELLVQQTLRHIHVQALLGDIVYIDVGTGSACVALSVIMEMHPLKFDHSFALDLSRSALEVAQKNIDTYAPGKIELLESNLLSVLTADTKIEEKNLIITANLPYIRETDTVHMDVSVLKHEPYMALFGGKDTGFELYTELIKQCFQIKHRASCKEIHLFIEIGYDQYEVSRQLLVDFGLSFEYFRDNASIYRVIHISGF